MPILKQQVDIHPDTLLENAEPNADRHWWLAYTLARREKDLMRRLTADGVDFYGPTYLKRHHSPAGRLRVVQQPLFPGYIFVFGDHEARRTALASNCIARIDAIAPSVPVTQQLQRLKTLLAGDREVFPEQRLEPG